MMSDDHRDNLDWGLVFTIASIVSLVIWIGFLLFITAR
jgi:hypothetical protein